MAADVRIEPAGIRDVPLILSLIKALAEYERLADEVEATEAGLREIGFCRGIGARATEDWTVYRLTGETLDRLAKA